MRSYFPSGELTEEIPPLKDELLRIKPVAAWDCEAGGTITCGTNWLSIVSNGTQVLRLHGAGDLGELQQMLDTLLDRAKRLQHSSIVTNNKLAVSLDFDAVKRCFGMSVAGRPWFSFEQIVAKQLSDWIAFMSGGRAGSYWHNGEAQDLTLKQRIGMLFVTIHAGGRTHTVSLRRDLAEDLVTVLLAAVAGQQKKQADSGNDIGVWLKPSKGIYSKIAIGLHDGVSLNNREMVCLAADISRWLRSQSTE